MQDRLPRPYNPNHDKPVYKAALDEIAAEMLAGYERDGARDVFEYWPEVVDGLIWIGQGAPVVYRWMTPDGARRIARHLEQMADEAEAWSAAAQREVVGALE